MGDDSLQSERHESLYFSDGNIVLLAPRQDEPGLLFRVHKSVLSYHSQVFSDMFDVCDSSVGAPGAAKAGHLYDCVPLIHVPDNAVHLELVLKVVHYQSDLPWSPRSPDYPTLVTPILDLSRKYRIERLCKQIQGQIESVWPQTLAEWDKLERDIEYMANDLDVKSIDNLLPEPGAAIKLARQFEFPNVLPAAFYHLSRLSILDNWDKTRANLSLLDSIQNRTRRTARWELLSTEDFQCLLLGKAELAGYLRKHMKVNSGRYHNTGIGVHCQGTAMSSQGICDRCSQSPDPLALLNTLAAGHDEEYCAGCLKDLRPKILKVRKRLWGKLECLFHLSGTTDVQETTSETESDPEPETEYEYE